MLNKCFVQPFISSRNSLIAIIKILTMVTELFNIGDKSFKMMATTKIWKQAENSSKARTH